MTECCAEIAETQEGARRACRSDARCSSPRILSLLRDVLGVSMVALHLAALMIVGVQLPTGWLVW